MIFQRALQRELASVAGATFTVLFTIFVTWTLISILGKAAGGKVASGDVLALIGFSVLNYLPTIIILTSFIAVIATVTRSYRDSEMVVWFASGQSLMRWVPPVLVFGLPMVAIVAALSFVATPWAKMKSAEFVERFEKREDLKRVSPGQFRESPSTNRVFFVEGSTSGATVVQNVFVNSVDADGNSIVVAKEGVIEPDGKGGQYLVLKNGRRYLGKPGRADFQSMEFERYRMRVSSQAPVIGTETPADALSTPALLALPDNRYTNAELLYRVSAPISCLVLMLLAIPLGFVNPRAGSSANLILALLIFFTYSNLSKLFEASVKQGKMAFGVAWWPLHVFALVVVAGLFAWRLNVNHPWHPLALLGALKRRRLLRGGAVTQEGAQ
ncbi:LPS export ABC transporter permease LptF [Massilia sp. Root133]|uniref:Lipopolysaccharide export system permease protein LptF n=1 Tax=Massilia cellulosiltytica TaxID=2683234 RepID=A0A7X3K6W0_9BURK|nr:MULTISPECIES: LPS export ABC transporter permease LptF [Telluria group]KQY11677.1 LPS export ABC transporter permease LptF [Massilia sp. Root133]KQZ46455.1 LPS export ABC transporter permease LptF [Massilia sp. Root1485]MVW60198.1 LPS export ABC transporter permease LptF [Telluria cellulosilytica]